MDVVAKLAFKSLGEITESVVDCRRPRTQPVTLSDVADEEDERTPMRYLGDVTIGSAP